LHTSTFDHPKALSVYQRAGFVAYARRSVLFEDPRERGISAADFRPPAKAVDRLNGDK
jgi:hypothetical protein